MTGLFTADVENRGLVLDPRTKLAVMITLVVFALGGTGDDITAVRCGTIVISILPMLLLVTAKQYKKAALFTVLFALVKAAELLLVSRMTGAAVSIFGICCMIFVRLMPGLIMGAYMLSSTTVSEFIAAMHRMHVPQQITIPMSVMFRFFPTVLEEFSAINTAMKMRGIRLGGKHSGKFIEYRLVPLMTAVLNIGGDLSASALSRGLDSPEKRTNACVIRFRAADYAITALCLAATGFLIYEKAVNR